MYFLTIDARMINASGIGTYLKNLIPYLINNFNITLLAYPNEIYKFSWVKFVNIIPMKSKIYSIREQIELPLKISKCDIFWSPHFNVPILPIKAKKRLVTIHDLFHLAFFHKLSLIQKIYIKTILNFAVRSSNKIITVSKFSKSEIIKYTKISKDKIEVIYNGIDIQKYKLIKNKTDFKKVINKYNLPNKFILYVGNIKPHKNLKNALLAYKNLLKNELSDFMFVIVGKKEGFILQDKKVFEIINNDDNLRKKVIFTGYVDDKDLPIIYNLASLLIFPSLYEGFGFPPLEAMACGCPVVTSNKTSIPEICGDAAYYINPNNIDDITKGIHEVLTNEDLRIKLIKKGLNRVKLFSWENTSKKLIKIINSLINNSK